MSDLENKIDKPTVENLKDLPKLKRLYNVYSYMVMASVVLIISGIAMHLPLFGSLGVVGFVLSFILALVLEIKCFFTKKALKTQFNDPHINWNMISTSSLVKSHDYFSSYSSLSSHQSFQSSFQQPFTPTLTNVPTMAENSVPNSGMQGYGPYGLYMGSSKPFP